jgi:hypothetical protein
MLSRVFRGVEFEFPNKNALSISPKRKTYIKCMKNGIFQLAQSAFASTIGDRRHGDALP